MANLENLRKQKQQLLTEKRPPRAREAAKKLDITEAEFVAISCGQSCSILDDVRFDELLQKLEPVGEVMALTRNDAMVLESHGIYKDVTARHGHIIINTEQIDLRLRTSAWKFGFAVEENNRQSLQFFDEFGEATHKIYIGKKSNTSAYASILQEFVTNKDFHSLVVKDKPAIEINEVSINATALQKDWRELSDVHQLGALLNKHNATRPQAYRHLGDDAVRLKNSALRAMLEIASPKKIPLLMFVPNSASTQIHNGLVNKLMEMGPWFNVLDPGFNLHANMKLIAETWLIAKIMNDKTTYSMEIFDKDHQALMMVYLHSSAKQDDEMQTLWKDTLQNLQETN